MGEAELIERWRESVRSYHDERVQKILDRLSDREVAIVREAAVMGFVQGIMHAGALGVAIPKDSEILYRTLDGIGAFPDTYTNLSGWTGEEEE